jgi:hypothetical protein
MRDYSVSAVHPRRLASGPLHPVRQEADMNPQDIDPSLRAAEPLLESLHDGFSPPLPANEREANEETEIGEPALGPQSAF